AGDRGSEHPRGLRQAGRGRPRGLTARPDRGLLEQCQLLGTVSPRSAERDRRLSAQARRAHPDLERCLAAAPVDAPVPRVLEDAAIEGLEARAMIEVTQMRQLVA